MKKDPYQLNNLIHDHAYDAVKATLREKLLAWIKKAENATPKIID